MLNENQINLLPERIYQRLNDINTEYLENIGTVIKDIGELRPTDVHQLQRMYDYGSDMEHVSRKLAEATEKNVREIDEIFSIVAKENYNHSKPFYEAKAQQFIPYEENEKLQRYVKTLTMQTVGEYMNLTQHTAFALFAKDGKSIAPLFESNKGKVPTSLSDTYTKLIDYAVTKVQLGVDSYNNAMREVMEAMAKSGIRTVDYATGYSRRLDTTVRQNILWGIKECNQNTADMIGKDFGADGYEISYHSHPRPGHADMGGKQYAIGRAKTVKGVYYPSFSDIEHLLKEYNCLHFKFSILLGISPPTYDESMLQELKAQDEQKFTFEGEEYTMYEGSQLQRKIETAIRNHKDRAIIAKAAGNDDMRRDAQEKINILANKYAALTTASGLPTKMERMQVKGFNSVKVKTFDIRAKSVIIREKSIQNGRYKISQQTIDDRLNGDLKGVSFTSRPVYNPRIRCDGKTTIALNKYNQVLYIEKIEIGNQSNYNVEYLEDTLIHEELEARIALKSRTSQKYKRLYEGSEYDRHNYINKVIKKFFKMKGWLHIE